MGYMGYSTGFQHPDSGYPMTALFDYDEGGECVLTLEHTARDYEDAEFKVCPETLATLDKLCERPRIFATLRDAQQWLIKGLGVPAYEVY